MADAVVEAGASVGARRGFRRSPKRMRDAWKLGDQGVRLMSADLILTTTDPTTEIADVLLRRIGELRPDLA